MSVVEMIPEGDWKTELVCSNYPILYIRLYVSHSRANLSTKADGMIQRPDMTDSFLNAS